MHRPAAVAVLCLALSACASGPRSAEALQQHPTATSTPAPTPAAPAVPTPAAPAVPAPARSETLAADTPRTTPGGATFTAPSGWTVTTREPRSSSSRPRRTPGWCWWTWAPRRTRTRRWRRRGRRPTPAMQRKLLLAEPRPGRNGWEERRIYTYETSPNEKRTVRAAALRAGGAWTVILIDGTDATLERRDAPTGLLIGSLRPKGYARESFAGKKPHPLDAARVEAMRSFVERSAKELEVPGVGFSLIQDGKVVFEGGVGVRELGKPQKVDADTLFMVGSNTKALTTLLLARLVDAKKLTWEQPVVQVDPSFKLGDADTTSRVLVKHLICACTGLPRQDMEWLFEYGSATPASSMKLLGTMQPTSKFGEVFQYSNLMAAAAGFVGGRLLYPDRELGAAYDAAMDSRCSSRSG
ncbi:serine hydrolase domain-containing protein [Cystobacter fuscus]